MARRRKGTEERRAELLAAARRLFVRDGFTEISVSRIVREVGVAQGTFYYYFDSKEAALDALLQEHVRSVAARLGEIAADPSRPPRAALRDMLRALLDLDARETKVLGSIRGADARTKLLAAAVRALSPLFAQVVRRGQAARSFAPGPPDLLGEVLVLLSHALLDRDLIGLTDQEYGLRRHHLAGLVGTVFGIPMEELALGGPPPRGR